MGKIHNKVKPDVRQKDVEGGGGKVPQVDTLVHKVRVHDVEHIAQLHEFVLALAQLHRMGSFTDSEIKMEIDQEQSKLEGFLKMQQRQETVLCFGNKFIPWL